MDGLEHSLLDDPLVTVRLTDGAEIRMVSLCELYPMLARDEVTDFPALRPHQRHVWHAFLVQVAALAVHRSGLQEMPEDPTTWRTILLGLTPDDPDGAAWALVSPLHRPALLQPPVPEGTLKGFDSVDTADSLDMLVTSKNHDVKRHVIRRGRPEAWLFALVSLQTQGGYSGRDNYGISRMNGGSSSRPGLGIEPPGGPGVRLKRDVSALLAQRGEILKGNPYYPTAGGIALVWLHEWDGTASLPIESLDPLYIEICRRIRFESDSRGSIIAFSMSTKKERIDAKSLNGRTGDPWTPLVADGRGRKALTIDSGGFSYRRLTTLLFPSSTDATAPTRSLLQRVLDGDAESGLSLIARGIVRGQGKTEGYHERRVPISGRLRRFLGPDGATDEVAKIASERVENVGTFGGKVLFSTAMTIYTAAPSGGERSRDDATAKSRAQAVVNSFEHEVDARFFSDLTVEIDVLGDSAAMRNVRSAWIAVLHDIGRHVIETTLDSAPGAAMRRYRIAARARRRFDTAFRSYFAEWIPDHTAQADVVAVQSDTPDLEVSSDDDN